MEDISTYNTRNLF